ncbi:MAG: hypothetical protein QW112_03435 [Candidatus Micrarchaeia archaeon]
MALQMIVLNEELVMLFAQPIMLFFFSIFIWSFQSFFITKVSREFIFPHLYRNQVTTYLVAQISIFLHEASHFLSAIFTGSSIISEETFIKPTHGRVAATSEESVVGWFSRMIAALAPSFLPPLLFLAIFFLVSGQELEFITNFSYSKTVVDFQDSINNGIHNILIPDIIALARGMTDLTNPLTFFLIYILMICSIAAGPSEGDWSATLTLFLSPIPAVTLFAIFLLFSVGFAQLNVSFVVPLMLLLILILAAVMLGVVYSFMLAQFLSLMRKRFAFAVAILVLFFATYYMLYYLYSDSVLPFILSATVTTITGIVFKKYTES